MTSLDAVCGVLARLAPLRLAEDWDNVGLLVGDRRCAVERVMTCLTVTPNVVREAIDEKVGMVVVHHPLPFKPLHKITSDSITGSMLLDLIGNRVAVYSAHTAFDSAADGINQMWGDLLGLTAVEPLVEIASADSRDVCGSSSTTGSASAIGTSDPIGSGRFGRLRQPESLGQLVRRAATAVQASAPRMVGDPDQKVSQVALACGSGGSFLSDAARRGCEVMITGEATFHTCLEAESRGIGLGLMGHYFSERFAMERLAVTLGQEFPDLTIWPSRSEHDPLRLVEIDR